jgi:hypothetical protein
VDARRLAAVAQAQRDAEDELFADLDDAQPEQLRVLLVALKDSLSGECASAAEPGRCAPAADGEEC